MTNEPKPMGPERLALAHADWHASALDSTPGQQRAVEPSLTSTPVTVSTSTRAGMPEAWPGCDTSVFRSSKGTASICVYDPEFGSWVFDISGVPLGEALVACLEAAAERRRQR
jgi:hypothetical protein